MERDFRPDGANRRAACRWLPAYSWASGSRFSPLAVLTGLVLVMFPGVFLAPRAPAQEGGAPGSMEVESGTEGSGAAAAKPTLGDLKRQRGATTEEPDAKAPPASRVAQYFRILGILVLVVAAAVATILLLKRFVPGTSRVAGNQRIEVISRAALTNRHQLMLVRVAERVLVLGVSPDGITPVSEISDPREVVQLAPRRRFEDDLTRERSGYEAATPSRTVERPGEGVAQFGREIDRLKSMVANWRSAPRAEPTT